MTNGNIFAQLIFNGKNLLDCEFLEDGKDFASEFVEKFMEEFNYIRNEKLSGTKHAKHHQYHKDFNTKNKTLTIKRNAKFIHLKKLQDIPDHFHELMNIRNLKKKCSQLHRQVRHKFEEENQEEDEREIKENIQR